MQGLYEVSCWSASPSLKQESSKMAQADHIQRSRHLTHDDPDRRALPLRYQ